MLDLRNKRTGRWKPRGSRKLTGRSSDRRNRGGVRRPPRNPEFGSWILGRGRTVSHSNSELHDEGSVEAFRLMTTATCGYLPPPPVSTNSSVRERGWSPSEPRRRPRCRQKTLTTRHAFPDKLPNLYITHRGQNTYCFPFRLFPFQPPSTRHAAQIRVAHRRETPPQPGMPTADPPGSSLSGGFRIRVG